MQFRSLFYQVIKPAPAAVTKVFCLFCTQLCTISKQIVLSNKGACSFPPPCQRENVVSTEFPWMHSAAFRLMRNSGSPKVHRCQNKKECCKDTLPVSGFHQPSLCIWISSSLFLFFFLLFFSRWIWIQGDVLNPHK